MVLLIEVKDQCVLRCGNADLVNSMSELISTLSACNGGGENACTLVRKTLFVVRTVRKKRMTPQTRCHVISHVVWPMAMHSGRYKKCESPACAYKVSMNAEALRL